MKQQFKVNDVVSCLLHDSTICIGNVISVHENHIVVYDFTKAPHEVPYASARLASLAEVQAANKAINGKTRMYKYVYTDGGGDTEIRFISPSVHTWVVSPVDIPIGDTSIDEKVPEECREACELHYDDVDDAMRCEVTIGSGKNDRAISAHCLLHGRVILDFFSEAEARECAEEHNIEIIDTVHWVMY